MKICGFYAIAGPAIVQQKITGRRGLIGIGGFGGWGERSYRRGPLKFFGIMDRVGHKSIEPQAFQGRSSDFLDPRLIVIFNRAIVIPDSDILRRLGYLR